MPTQNDAPNDTRTLQRDKLIEAMIPHVQFDGWSRAALHMAAEDLDLSKKEADRILSGGPVDFVMYHCDKSDRDMMNAFEALDLESLKIRDRIGTAVKTRLMLHADHRDAVRKGATVMAMPQNSIQSVKCLYKTVDVMWYAAGDTATDWNFYSKRMLLSGVYSSTLLYWLNDASEDFSDSWAFLDRRIADVMKVPKIKAHVADAFTKICDLSSLRKKALGSKALSRFKVKNGMNR